MINEWEEGNIYFNQVCDVSTVLYQAIFKLIFLPTHFKLLHII